MLMTYHMLFKKSKIALFADDNAISLHNKAKEFTKIFQSDLNRFPLWLKINKLTLNVETQTYISCSDNNMSFLESNLKVCSENK